MPNIDVSLFPYVHLAAGVVTVVVSVWLLLKSQKSDMGLGRFGAHEIQYSGGGTQVYLGGMFREITQRLDRITDAVKDVGEVIKDLDERMHRRTEKLYEAEVQTNEALRNFEHRTSIRSEETQRLYRDIIEQLERLNSQMKE